MKEKIKQTQEKPELTKQKTEEQKIVELNDELKVKRKQLKEDNARLGGGFSEAIGRDYLAIDIEVSRLNRIIEMRKIELSKDAPLRPKFTFEQDERWRAINKEFRLEELGKMEEQLANIKKQKEHIIAEIPQLKIEINKVEKELGQEVTNFKKEKIDYVG